MNLPFTQIIVVTVVAGWLAMGLGVGAVFPFLLEEEGAWVNFTLIVGWEKVKPLADIRIQPSFSTKEVVEITLLPCKFSTEIDA